MKRARTKKKETPVKKTSTKKKTTKKSTKKSRKKGKKLKIFLSIILCALIAMFIALGFGTEDNALFPIDTSTGKMNVLFLGTDKEGLRTDAMMIASYDFDNESLNILSVPRDTKVYVTNRKLTRKINEVHAMSKGGGEIMGPLASVEAVSALTGIPINYYVEFSFEAIDNMMEILGPVTFDVPDIEGRGRGMNYDDPAQDLHIHLKPGVQELSGNQVQQFLRYRKSNDGTVDGSDTSRVARQQEFLKALLEQKVNLSLIVKAPDIFNQIKKDIKTNFSAGEVAKYATHLLKLTPDKINTYSLPGEDKYVGGGWYFVPDMEAVADLIENTFGFDASGIDYKLEITGEKYTPKQVKTANPDKSATPKPTEKASEEASASPTPKPTPTPTATENDETPKPTKSASPTPKPTQEPTTEPLRPTQKPTQEPDDDYIYID